ncbi:MAG: type II toxin-antitoxin system VapC family toxin [Chloroflexota bacterium]
MQLVDANILIYAVNADAPNHAVCRRWLDAALGANDPVGFAWIALLAFLRVVTNPTVLAEPWSVHEATDQVRTWLTAPAAVVVEPTARHADVLAGLLSGVGTAGNLVSDAHLAALATEHLATVVTFDLDFARFPGVRSTQPAA